MGKIIVPILVTFLFCCCVSASDKAIKLKFEEFKNDFGKKYENAEEESRRFEIFKEKVSSIEKHNARADVSFKKGNLRSVG